MRLSGSGHLFGLALWGVTVAASGLARADSTTDTIGVRALGEGEAVRASANGATAIGVNPAGVALSKSYSVEGLYGYRSEDSATIVGAAVCDSTTNRVAACLNYTYFNAAPITGPRTLHDIGLTVSVPAGDKIMFGQTTRYVDYTDKGTTDVPLDNSRNGDLTSDIGMVAKLADEFALAGVFYNLLGHDDHNFPRAIGTGVALTLAEKLNIGFDAVWKLDHPDGQHTGRYSVGSELFLNNEGSEQGYALRAGYVFDRSTKDGFFTAGAGFVTPRLGLDVGMRKQVSGTVGDELIFEVGLRLFVPQ